MDEQGLAAMIKEHDKHRSYRRLGVALLVAGGAVFNTALDGTWWWLAVALPAAVLGVILVDASGPVKP